MTDFFLKNRLALGAILIVAVMAAPLVVYPIFLMKVLCFAVAASAVNLMLGYMGMLSFGHAMFFGMSSYISAHLLKVEGFTPEAAIILATLASTVLGYFAGLVAIRRQGIYFAMITLAIAQVIYFFALQAPFTHGEDGIQNVPRNPVFGVIDISSDYSAYIFTAVICIAALLAIGRLVHSPLGRVMTAVRDNEARAVSLGYRADREKLRIFVISASFAGLAGATKVIAVQLASLTDVSWHMSGELVLMCLIGGLGTLMGPLVGACIIVAIGTYLAGLSDWVLIIQGSVFFVTVLMFREGLIGYGIKIGNERRARNRPAESASAGTNT